MSDRGFFLTLNAMRRQLAAMPSELYLVRMIHGNTRTSYPGERLWTAALLTHAATVRFLRARNREGFDIYIHGYAERRNAGYILIDLDCPRPDVIEAMRTHGHEPCLVLATSPGHLQAWIRVSVGPLEPTVASAIGRHLAHLYGGDPASTDWRHLGRLAGFTNQKPQRRRAGGFAPWVKLLHAEPCLATQAASLLETALRELSNRSIAAPVPDPLESEAPESCVTPSAATTIYQTWLERLRIPQRFPHIDWSIADLWIAKELLQRGVPPARVQAILRFGSPQFPRRHADPDDYLRRTLTRAACELALAPFPARPALARVSISHDDSPAVRDLP